MEMKGDTAGQQPSSRTQGNEIPPSHEAAEPDRRRRLSARLTQLKPLPSSNNLSMRNVVLSEDAQEADDEILQRIFRSIDTDNSGGIEKHELVAALEKMGWARSKAEVYELFDDCDHDHDGRIDFREFCLAVKSPSVVEKWLSTIPLARYIANRVGFDGVGGSDTGDKDNPYEVISTLTPEYLDEVIDACVPGIKAMMHEKLKSLQDGLSKCKSRSPATAGPSKFGFFQLKQGESVGSIADFVGGIENRIGNPLYDLRKGMEEEHLLSPTSTAKFTTSNYGITTTPADEWRVVVEGEKPKTTIKQRVNKPLKELMESDKTRHLVGPVACGMCKECKEAETSKGKTGGGTARSKAEKCLQNNKLTDSEVIAVQLYTGPMFQIYNTALRKAPPEMYRLLKYTTADGTEHVNTFTNTIHALVSAVIKIQRKVPLPDSLTLYRGLGQAFLPKEFFESNKSGIKGLTEFGFMSTTRKRSVAIEYSGIKSGNPVATVLSMVCGAVDRAASIQALSQFPQEEEYLWVPMSYLEPAQDSHGQLETTANGVVKILPIRCNANLKTYTVEELLRRRKTMMLKTLHFHERDLDRELDAMSTSDLAVQKRKKLHKHDQGTVEMVVEHMKQEFQKLGANYRDKPATWYNTDAHFRSAINEVLQMKTMAVQALRYFLTSRQGATISTKMDLRRGARKWRRDIELRISKELDGAEKKVLAKVLCECEGLNTDSDSCINESGETPLFTAAANGSILHVELLLAAGADIESAVDRHGFTALMTASELGHEKVVETLLAAGADVNRCNKSASISPAHQTAIYIAAREGHDHCLQVLLAAPGADVNSRTVNSRSQEQGHSALTASALNGHILCVERLLAAGAEIDAPGLKGLPAVSWAVFSRHIDVVRLLIGRHANVNTKVTEGAFKQGTPLTLAIEWSRDCTVEAEAGSVVLEIVKELLGAGAAVNAPGIEGNTPLMLATKTGNLAIVGELLSMGADVNLHNLHHETALHMAAKGETDGHVSCAKRLIASNASVSKKNAKGKTPLAVAKESTSKQKAAMQDLLLEAASSGEN